MILCLQAHDVKFWYHFYCKRKTKKETNGLQYSIVAVKEIKPRISIFIHCAGAFIMSFNDDIKNWRVNLLLHKKTV